MRTKSKTQGSYIDESDSSIFTQEIYVIQNSIIYSLDVQNEIAEVIGNKDANGEIFIPYSIICLKKRFIVTSILQNSFKNSQTIRSINFPDNSKLKTIEKESFANSTIESLTLPSNVSVLNDEWCSNTPKLSKIRILPRNNFFIYLDEKSFLSILDQ